MKKALILVAILLLTSSLAWAEGAAGATAAAEVGGQADAGSTEGNCTLPDFAGLSPEQRLIAALAAGFQTSGAFNVQTQICPDVFRCASIPSCRAGSPCSIQDIGPCCDLGGGETLCCANGNIKIRRCPCECTSFPCALLCLDSTETTLSCR